MPFPKGRKQTEKWREAMRLCHVGRIATKAQKEKVSNTLKGHVVSHVTREKISRTLRVTAAFGDKHSMWLGGVTKNHDGRIMLSIRGGRKRRSHVVAEKQLGRLLTSKEVIHHIDEDKTNDSVENLFLFRNQSAHARWHTYLNRHDLVGLLTSNLV